MKKNLKLDKKDDEILDTIGALVIEEEIAERDTTLELIQEHSEETKPTWSKIKKNMDITGEALHRRLENLRGRDYLIKKEDPEDRRKKIYRTTKKAESRLALENLGIDLNIRALKSYEDSADFEDFLKHLGESLVFAISKIKNSDVDIEYAWEQFLKGFISLEDISLFQHLDPEILSEFEEEELESFKNAWKKQMEPFKKAPSGDKG